MRVWLVATVHEPAGQVTVSGLLTILERIAPEVIFLEMPVGAIWAFLDGTRSNLESRAVNLYRAERDVSLVPVDMPTPPPVFFQDIERFLDRIESSSPEYSELVAENSRNTEERGFAYLNSIESDEAWTAIYEALELAVRELDDPKEREPYDVWKATHEARENAMQQKIVEYSRAEPFNNAVLLVGAAHRRALLERERKHRGAGGPTFETDLSSVLDVADPQ